MYNKKFLKNKIIDKTFKIFLLFLNLKFELFIEYNKNNIAKIYIYISIQILFFKK